MPTTEQFNQPAIHPTQIAQLRDVWRIFVASIAAIFSGFVSEQGWPGSLIAFAPALIFGFLILRQSLKGWSRTTLMVACLNLVLLSAVLLEPSPLNLGIEWITLSSFAFVQNDGALNSVFNIAKATASSLFKTPLLVKGESRKVKAIHNQNAFHRSFFSFTNLLLPIIATLVFGMLFIIANPLIENSMLQLSWLDPSLHLLTWMPAVSFLSFIIFFAILKLKPSQNSNVETVSQKIFAASFFKPMPVISTLAILNLMFAAENILDLRYLWSGTSLPTGMNYAEYVHRGSYTLIVTAILAGALMIFALQPGSQGETSKTLRGLIYLWTLQNLFLVASSAKRTLDYVDAYGMTLWRLSGLIWMGLVAAGLILIVLRVILKRNSVWLLNGNLIAGYLVLLVCGLSDFSRITANWNVERAVQHLSSVVQSQTLDVDIDYLASLGPSALPAVRKLLPITYANNNILINYKSAWSEVFTAHNQIVNELRTSQFNWRTWTLRGMMVEAQ